MQLPHIQHLGNAISKALTEEKNETQPYPAHNYSPLVTIQTGRPNVSPLFCVPGAGASITAFCSLSQALELSLPIYGLQPRGLDGSLVPHADVPSAARSYIQAIRAVCPTGPYQLLGHSFGGLVVFEMAQQLVASGEQIAALIILDAEAPSTEEEMKVRHTRVPMLLKLVELFELSGKGAMGLKATDFTPLEHNQQLALLLERLIDKKLMPPRTNIQVLRNMVRVFDTNLNTNYVPTGIYDGALHFVEVAATTSDLADTSDLPDLITAWRRHAPNATSWRGPGNHMTLLTPPYVTKLAEWLHPLLKEMK